MAWGRKQKKQEVQVVPQRAETPIPFDAGILSGRLADSSIAMYRRDFAAYCAWTEKQGISPLEAAHLNRWLVYLVQQTAHSPNTINRMLSAVRRLMDEAARQNYITFEQAEAFARVKGVKIAALRERLKPHAKVRIPPAEMRQIQETPSIEVLKGLRDRALLATIASSGLRVSEAATLTMQQISPAETGYLLRVLGKNDEEERDALLSREAYALIISWMETRPVQSNFIFTAFDGRGKRLTTRHMTRQAIWSTVRAYALQSGFEHIKPHDFRRFLATQLGRKNLIQAKKALGHKRIATTERYVLEQLEAGISDNLY